MSNPPAKLSQHQVNKKITAKVKNRDEEWMENTTKLYREERWKVYTKKREEFLNAAKRYHNLNKLAAMSNRTKLESHYREMSFPFLEEETEIKTPDEYDSVQLLRTRHLRKAHEETPTPNLPVCTMESWFKRYVSLGKFINTARRVVIKRRLLKNLERLKQVNDDDIAKYEKEAKTCDNVSYADVFEKFLVAPPETCKPSFIEEDAS